MSGERETLLLVDDHDAVRKLALTILQRHGYLVFGVRTGTEALTLSRLHEGTIHLLVADLFMPQMDGVELARRLVTERPDMRVLFVSGSLLDGYPFPDELAASGFLSKPFRPNDLVKAVRLSLDT
jgi:CheY-like chemotaxis protein